jgi:formylmethanofuran dehydrogenase subunit B
LDQVGERLEPAVRLVKPSSSRLFELMAVFTNVACAQCGCVCDDLVIHLDGDRIVEAGNACTIAEQVFDRINQRRPAIAAIRGTACELAAALEAATEILHGSRAPLIFGMGRSATDGHRAAIQLAETLGGAIDSTGTAIEAAAILALQQQGAVTCTLGEVRQRADLVIFWGCDPETTHPRHLERYSAFPASEFLPNGRQDRTLIAIQEDWTPTGGQADLVLTVAPGRHFELLTTLRQLIRDPEAACQTDCGIPVPALRELARRCCSARYGTIFYGSELARGSVPHLTLETLHRFIAELNTRTRFTVRRLGGTSPQNVLAWQTGFPLAVDFRKGFPRAQPGEFSAEILLERREVDACLMIGSQALESLSAAALDQVKSLPTILIDPVDREPWLPATVSFTCAVYGIHAAGTVYRMDDVPLPLRQLISTSYPTEAALLQELNERCCDRGTPE